MRWSSGAGFWAPSTAFARKHTLAQAVAKVICLLQYVKSVHRTGGREDGGLVWSHSAIHARGRDAGARVRGELLVS